MHIRSALLLARRPAALVDFAQALADRDITLVSTGSTAAALIAAGLIVRLEEGLPPDLLAIGDGDRAVQLLVTDLPAASGLSELDIVVPSLIRSAARAHDRVAVLIDPADRPGLLASLDAGGPGPELRRAWAVKAARRVVEHDEELADALAITETGELPAIASFVADFPDPLFLEAERIQTLAHGENPHQRAALYGLPTPPERPSLARAERLQGRTPSYNGLLDLDAALGLALDLPAAGAVLVQHGQPIGAAEARHEAEPLAEIYARARLCDPGNVRGAVLALNRPVGEATAARLIDDALAGVIAPRFDRRARALLARRPGLRVMALDPWPTPGPALDVRRVAGGLLVQERDARIEPVESGRVVTRRSPDPAQWQALGLAWRVACRVPSSAVVLARPGQIIGIGAGQPGRLDACRLAVDRARRAGHDLSGAVAASDGHFPFADALAELAHAGVTAWAQPGGGVRDSAVVDRADRSGVAMVFTGVRHLRH